MLQRVNFDRIAADPVRSWERIEAWLRINLPETANALRAGALSDRLAWFEKHVRRALPADVRRTWGIHDGQAVDRAGVPSASGVFLGVAMLPLLDPDSQSALAVRRREMGAAGTKATDGWSSFPAEAVLAQRWNPAWIPLGIDPSGNVLAVDLEPALNGNTGQVIAVGRDDRVRYVLARDWACFLEDVADEFEAGGFQTLAPRTLLDHRREWSLAKLGASSAREMPIDQAASKGDRPMSFRFLIEIFTRLFRPRTPAPAVVATAPASYPIIAGPIAAECVETVRGFIDAMYQYERHWLAIRPLRPFGYSEISEQGEPSFSSGGIEDEADARPEADLVRLFHAGEFEANDSAERLTDPEIKRVLRIGQYFEEGIAQKRAIFQRFWAAISETDNALFNYSDPPAYDPARNKIAEVRQVSRDHVLVFFEPETETGQPEAGGFHLKPVEGRWKIDRRINHTDPLCGLLKRPSLGIDFDDLLAKWHPDEAAIAKAREMLKILETDPLLDTLAANGGDLFAALSAVGAEFELDDDGVCVLLALDKTAITDAGMQPLAALTGIREFMFGPKLTDAGMVHLAGMTEMTDLHFSFGHARPKINGIGLAHLSKMNLLECLDLGYLPLTDEGMAHLNGPENLRELRLYHTNLTDSALISVARLPNLEELILRETRVAGPGLAHLASLKKLRSLDLGQTPLDDAGAIHLTGLVELRELDLNDTKVTAAGRARLQAALPNCAIE